MSHVRSVADIEPRWKDADNQPSHVAQPGSLWITRKYQLDVTTTGNAARVVTVGDLSSALGVVFSNNARFKIAQISAWNSRLGGSIRTDVSLDNLQIGTTESTISCTDYGSGTVLAGTKLVIPSSISQSINVSSTATTPILSLSDLSAASGLLSPMVVQFTVAISI
jgi:hypothetical protein